jgi:hypothetical protein
MLPAFQSTLLAFFQGVWIGHLVGRAAVVRAEQPASIIARATIGDHRARLTGAGTVTHQSVAQLVLDASHA